MWEGLGLPGLFLASFLAATILPFSSEALLAAMAIGPWSWPALWLTASIGNTLGGLSSTGLGRLGRRLTWQGVQAGASSGPWTMRIRRWGPWAALLTWLPVVGDAIAVALGVVGAPWGPTALLMFVGKAARYAVVLGAMRAMG
ncbi:MAG: DedA family protein [Flavobacteriales bacterium]|nr:DedA family protein [Flavobacteriales bacterium]MBK7943485.1 DedA family protein [Flavobacteriales bacterium]MBK8950702.1 DedA family protein [Flavobacteriales bacterium]MBK9699825.1 DedA family protein [Flavobacteriales bacterium]